MIGGLAIVLLGAAAGILTDDDQESEPVETTSSASGGTTAATEGSGSSGGSGTSPGGGLSGLTDEQKDTVDDCAGGDIDGCVKARKFLNDGHISTINEQCSAGNSSACSLKENLVKAELKELCDSGDQNACDQLGSG